MTARCIHKLFPTATLVLAIAVAVPVFAQGVPTPLLPQPQPRGEPPAVVNAAPPATGSTETKTVIDDIRIDELGPMAAQSDAVGTIDGFGPDLWRGTQRTLISTYLPRLPAPATSPTVRSLAARLLLTSAAPPPAAAGTKAESLIAIRLAGLAALGDADDFIALARALPNANDEVSTRARIEAALLAGDDAGACGMLEDASRSSGFRGGFWTHGVTLCDVVGGRSAQAQLALDLASEQGMSADSPFEALLRAALGDRSRPVSSFAGAGPIEVALLRLSKAQVAPDALPGASALALRALALGTGQLPVRLDAAERAEAFGAIPIDKLAELYLAVPFKHDELANALTAAAGDPSPRGRALFYRAAQGQDVPAAKAEAIKAALAAALSAARDQGRFAQAVRLYAKPVAAIDPAPELAWFAEDAARVLYASGNVQRADEWRAVAARGPDAATIDVALWPFAAIAAVPVGSAVSTAAAANTVVVASPQAKPFDSAGFATWQASLPEPDRAGKAAVVLALLDSLGVAVPPEVWAPFLDAAATAGRSSPLIGPLTRAAAGGRTGETVLLGLVALGSGDPSAWPPETVAAVDAALLKVNLGADARALALEAAVGAGF